MRADLWTSCSRMIAKLANHESGILSDRPTAMSTALPSDIRKTQCVLYLESHSVYKVISVLFPQYLRALIALHK